MWRVIKKMYESSKSAVLLEGEKSDTFTIEQGVAQGCSLSPILFSVFVKLDMYKRFGKSIEFKKYLHGIHVMQEVVFCLSLDQVHTV